MIELDAMGAAPGGVLAARGAVGEPEGFTAVTHEGRTVMDDQGRTVIVEAAA
nr:hypothetical protein [uncultured Brevundimonas sp.]